MPTNTEKLFNDATTLVHERGVVYGHAIYNMQRISNQDSIVDIIAYMAIYKMCIDAETDGEFEFREGE